jgi:hypothetical protein
MVDKSLDKADEAAGKFVDNVKEGQSDDSPIELPGTFKKRDSDTDEVVEEMPAETGRGDDIPNPGRS